MSQSRFYGCSQALDGGSAMMQELVVVAEGPLILLLRRTQILVVTSQEFQNVPIALSENVPPTNRT
jgi:hypothetical protein